ncbi:DUF6077 domain-containing protein [Micromonospora sp. CPCC 205561]|uniref:DUF6077 domain-containing protein n=1 Tax=Micromonospora sp. CPCC 205561 TaxID=3122407 RepID=UPI002FF40D14
MSKVGNSAVAEAESDAVRPRAPRRGAAAWLGALVVAAPRVLTDAGVIAFALFTVIYHVAFLFHLRPSVIFLIWLVGCVLLGGLAVTRALRRRRAATPDEAVPGATGDPEAGPSRRWLLVAVVAGAGAAVTASVARGMPWWVPAALGLVASVTAALLARRRWLTGAGADAPATGVGQAGYALVISALVAVSSFFMARNSKDDVFYVGKSVWVAERDDIPLRDFLFTEGVAPALTTQPPISSIEVFAGALGRFLGVHAASATWYVLLPVLAVLAVLALWRLVHRWAPRRPVLAFTVAVVYLYLVVGSDAALGTFHLPRLYEGKGMFVSAVVPLMWVYLTDWFESRSRWRLFLVVALSIVATGLSSTSAIILPILVGAAGAAMLLVGRWREAVLAFVAATAYPLASVVVSRIALGPVTQAGGETQFFDAEGTYRRTLLIGVLGVIGGLALWCAPLLVRRRTPRLLAAGAAVTMSVLLVPGVLELLGDLSGVSAVLWRVPWILALPGLIGILCTAALPGGRRVINGLVGAATAAALVASFAVWGVPMWSTGSFVEVRPHPIWKLPQQRQKIVFWMQGLERPPGLLLAPSTLMRITPIITTRMRVVMPRDGYLIEYDQSSDFVQDRLKLAALADGRPDLAPLAELAAAVDRLDVTTICVYSGNRAAREIAVELGFQEFAARPAPGAVRCFRQPG